LKQELPQIIFRRQPKRI